MQVNLRTTNYDYGMQNKVANHKQQSKQSNPALNEGLTASIYFGQKDKTGKALRNAAMAFVIPLTIATVPPALTSCEKELYTCTSGYERTSNKSSYSYSVSSHAKGCNCDECRKGRDTLYVDRDHIIYVDTGSYHVTHDTIIKWKHDFQKPIPLDSIAKDLNTFGDDSLEIISGRTNIVHYEATREWEYGENFVSDINLLESSKNILVYDREDKDWKGLHTGWGKDVYRIPETNFTIQTYGGRKINNPKGYFVETYVNEADKKESIASPDRKLVSRQFMQTVGDSVNVFTYDPKTRLYREDGRVSAGYLDKATKGGNILLTDLIASDPDKQFTRDPEYLTEDHLTNVKVVAVNDEELELLYVRAKDDEYAEQHYGSVQ